MANEKPVDPTKKVRAKSTYKDKEWSLSNSGKLAVRNVKSVYGPTKTPIEYVEFKLHKVSDPAEALQLLKLKSSRAVAAIVKGHNQMLRVAAAGDEPLIKKIAERKGISLEEARKRFEAIA